MIETKENETEKKRPVFVECATAMLSDEGDDEVTLAKSIFDEIVEETENEENTRREKRKSNPSLSS